MPRLLRIAGAIAILVAVQVLLVVAAIATHQKWLLAPLAPGLWSMRWLPADPRTAGSFIVFPTLSQTLLALAVNAALYGVLLLSLVAWRRRRNPAAS